MKSAVSKLKILISLMILNLFGILYGQEVLTNLNTTWSNVLPGTVICQPVITSYGFCIATDAKNVCAFSNTGNQLWEKQISRSKKVRLTALPDDFILFLDLTVNEMKLLNPSGCEIWSKKLDFIPEGKVFPGRDGRFFIAGSNELECYGINGVCKWSFETESLKPDFLQELPDGSLVVFMDEIEGKTKGLRLSPFGELLEEILFAGQVINTYTCCDGVLLTFSDGSSGLFSTENNEAKNKWVIDRKAQKSYFAINENTDYVFLEGEKNSVLLHELDKSTGAIIHSFRINGLDGQNLSLIKLTDSGIFLSDLKNAFFYNLNGNELWSANLPYKKNQTIWNYNFYTNNDCLIFCYKDWTLNAYRVIQNLKKDNNMKKNYNEFYTRSENTFDILYSKTFSKETVNEERIQKLKEGNYGYLEQKWENEITTICKSYSTELSTTDFGTHKERSIFDTDTTGFEKILSQLTLFCNSDSQNCAAAIIEKTDNKSFLKVLLNGVKENGYDPDGVLINAIQKKASKADYKDKILINSICDAVYSICVFMGRPAYNSKGKEILKNFLYPNFDSKTREYARETLKKIIALDL